MIQGQRKLKMTYAVGCTAAAAWRSAAVIAVLSAAVLASQFVLPVHLADSQVRAGIELIMAVCALASAAVVVFRWEHNRRLSDLLLLGTMVAVALTEATYASTAMAGAASAAEPAAALRVVSEALLALTFGASALVTRSTPLSLGRRTVATVGGWSLATAAVIALLAPSAEHPFLRAIVMASGAVLVAASIEYVRRASGGDREAGMLAAASIIVTAATLQYLAIPVLAASWVTPGDGLRAVAYALLVVTVFQRALQTKRHLARQATIMAVDAERERIARDLHDGLAQDLAFIAAHGQRLSSELGPDHPLSVAAKRALATTRGAIVDLSATDAPTAGAALKQVADELAERFSVRVDVEIAEAQSGADLEPAEREEVVRIAREAIVNAVKHGRAHHITVSLDCRGQTLRLRVSDDGIGMPEALPSSSSGHGLPTMQARAESLGGQLTVRRSALGGTELEVA
jgi:signal transduction histidine kinase